jgi:alpha-L-fucosidase
MDPVPTTATPAVIVDTAAEPVAKGRFQPTWESLKQYRTPAWFGDAKFGIWAHWGPQSQPQQGDWYARNVYNEGNWQAQFHLDTYGHPSTKGFKEVIPAWTAENWNPDELLALFQRAGARYFVAMANHHDNFDNWNSKYQPWNSVNLGPKRDVIDEWAKASAKHGLKFGVSVHAAHAWSWYEVAQGADKEGPFAGVPYDGKQTKADGKGTWWEGYDPQDLYEQRHAPSRNFDNFRLITPRWNWGNGASQPDQAYCGRFFNRTMDLINKHHPELVVFDDTALPLWPVSDAGLKLAAHYYNSSNQWSHGENDGVLFGKILNEEQRKCMAWEIERGSVQQIEARPWQTETCIGNWHYRRALFEQHRYKTAKTVVHTLVDVVSKNGNLLLNVPVKGDGTLDSDEVAILESIAAWMEANGKAIHATRPWKVFGEGPAMPAAGSPAQDLNEGKGKPYTAEDVRFTQSKDGKTVYAIALGWPEKPLSLRSLARDAGTIRGIRLLGSDEPVLWKQEEAALSIQPPRTRSESGFAAVYEVAFDGTAR